MYVTVLYCTSIYNYITRQEKNKEIHYLLYICMYIYSMNYHNLFFYFYFYFFILNLNQSPDTPFLAGTYIHFSPPLCAQTQSFAS